MSTLAVAEVAEQRQGPTSSAVAQPKPHESPGTIDQHPLVPVFIAGIIALVLSGAMVGTIVLMLALRHSGVMAP